MYQITERQAFCRVFRKHQLGDVNQNMICDVRVIKPNINKCSAQREADTWGQRAEGSSHAASAVGAISR